jgi:preprotein translocase subunit SecE
MFAMSVNTESFSSKRNGVLWTLIVLIFLAALVANYYFTSIATPIRIIAWIVIFSGLLGLSVLTDQGRTAVRFIGEAKIELRKVFWPTKQETIQTTLIVMAMVLVTALLLWGMDAFMLWAISWLTGQRG